MELEMFFSSRIISWCEVREKRPAGGQIIPQPGSSQGAVLQTETIKVMRGETKMPAIIIEIIIGLNVYN